MTMKRVAMLLSLGAVVMLAMAGSASAIDSGPGGTLYLRFNSSGTIGSVTLDTNWNATASANNLTHTFAPAAYVLSGSDVTTADGSKTFFTNDGSLTGGVILQGGGGIDFGITPTLLTVSGGKAIYYESGPWGDAPMGLWQLLDSNGDGVADQVTNIAPMFAAASWPMLATATANGKNFLFTNAAFSSEQMVVRELSADGKSIVDALTLTNTPPGGLDFNIYNNKVAAFEFVSAQKPGDCDGNGKVDDNDLNALLSAWGAGTTWAQGNFKGTGVTDDNDLNALLTNWGAGTSAAVPEPVTMSLLALGGLALLRRKS